MKNKIAKTLTNNAIVLAIYFLLTFISSPISFGVIQVRIAEFLILLCFFRRDLCVGVTLGCLLANTFTPGSLGVVDIVFGSLATLISCLGVSFCKHLAISTIIPVVVNGFVVGAELYYLSETTVPFFGIVGFVALGELIAVSLVGYFVFLVVGRNKRFLELIMSNQNTEFKW